MALPVPKADLDTVRTATSWGVAESIDLLTTFGSPQAALAAVEAQRRTVTTFVAELVHTRRTPSSVPRWIRVFATRSLPGGRDRFAVEWRAARAEFEGSYRRLTHPAASSFAELRAAASTATALSPGLRAFYEMGWAYAKRTALVPRFESAWLQELRRDPAARLRPLAKSQVADVELQRFATVPLPAGNDLPAYVAESISQATEYLNASAHATIAVRPLLLYYAAVCLGRAVVAPHVRDIRVAYAAHGLQHVTAARVRNLADVTIATTVKKGLAHALVEGLESPAFPRAGVPVSVLECCRYIPELSELLDAYGPVPSHTTRILRWTDHTRGAALPGQGLLGIVVPVRWLEQKGIDVVSPGLDLRIRALLPHAFWALARDLAIAHNQPPIERVFSGALNESVLAYCNYAPTKDDQRRLYPLIHQGALDGSFFVVSGGGGRPPHPFLPLFLALYALGMLVRYKPLEWRAMLDAADSTTALIEQLLRVATEKLPILATEELLNVRVLGSSAAIPA